MEQSEMFQIILKEVRASNKEITESNKEVKESIKEVKDSNKELKESIKEIKNELDHLNKKVDRIEITVNSHTEILNSFKFDVDFLAEKQTKTEMKVNRLEKMMES